MTEDVSIFQEIDDALRAEKLQEIWSRYSGFIIAFCVIAILSTAISEIWKNHRREVNERETSELIESNNLAQSGKYEEAIVLYEKIEDEGGKLSTIAALHHAQALLALKQQDKALAVYDAVMQGKKGDGPASLRDFATLQVSILRDNAKTGTKTHVTADNIFSQNIAEVSAVDALLSGDNKSTSSSFTAIMNNENAPISQRARAADLMSLVKEPGK